MSCLARFGFELYGQRIMAAGQHNCSVLPQRRVSAVYGLLRSAAGVAGKLLGKEPKHIANFSRANGAQKGSRAPKACLCPCLSWCKMRPA